MTTPRIEETINKIVEAGKQRADWFEPSAEVILATTAKEQILKAHQAGRDEAVEIVQQVKSKLPYGYVMTETCADEKVGAYIQALDDTIKALQDNN